MFVFDDPSAWLVVDQPYYAIGSGSPFALGALAQGASAKEAVEAAAKSDPFTGMGVKSYNWNS
jgi:20S proteasome alpha/beta subunit